jgi:hypothetical protein
LSLGFDIILLFHWILLAFRMLILLEVVLTKRAHLVPMLALIKRQFHVPTC